MSGFVLGLRPGDLMLLAVGQQDERVIAAAPSDWRCGQCDRLITAAWRHVDPAHDDHVPPDAYDQTRRDFEDKARRRRILYPVIVEVGEFMERLPDWEPGAG